MTSTARAHETRGARGAWSLDELRAMEDRDLAAAVLGGDERSFRELVRRYQPGLLAFVRRIVGDRERGEDLVQEVFIRVHQHLHRYDRTKRLSAWIYTIAANLAKNELRDRSHHPWVLIGGATAARPEENHPFEVEDTSTRPDDLYRARELCALVERATARLSTQHRAVFVLRELEDRSYEEIARITGVKLGTVRSRLNRARQSFADIIRPWVE